MLTDDQAHFDDFVLNEEDFNLISAAGKANPVRGNVPAGYRPAAWPINIFDTEEEREYDLRPWWPIVGVLRGMACIHC